MKRVEACFKISFTDAQLENAKAYVADMKKHPKRVYWLGKEGKSDDELIYAHIAHKVLSGYYNSYNPIGAAKHINEMKSYMIKQ